MKKILAVLAMAGVMVSCKDKKKDEPKPADTNTTTTTTPTDNTTPTTTTPTTTDNTAMSGETPKFADADVQKFVDDYSSWVKSYVDAYKNKDMSKINEAGAKTTEWANRSTEIAKKLAANPADAQKYSDYMMKLSKDLQAAMTMK